MAPAEAPPWHLGVSGVRCGFLGFFCVQGLLAARSGPGVGIPIVGSASQDWSKPLVADTANRS